MNATGTEDLVSRSLIKLNVIEKASNLYSADKINYDQLLRLWEMAGSTPDDQQVAVSTIKSLYEKHNLPTPVFHLL